MIDFYRSVDLPNGKIALIFTSPSELEEEFNGEVKLFADSTFKIVPVVKRKIKLFYQCLNIAFEHWGEVRELIIIISNIFFLYALN